MNPQTIDVAPLDLRADIGTVQDDARTVELTFSTGQGVVRFDWMTGKRYLEVLSMDPKHIRMQRLNGGAPLLDSHSAYSLAHQIGVVERAEVDGKKGTAVVRFSKRADVEPFYQDVRDKIIRNVSVGYRVHRFEETQGKGEMPTRVATDWEPYEISMVPMGADSRAQVRHSKDIETNPCVIVRASEEQTMANENPVTPETPAAPAAPAVDAAAVRVAAQAEERQRIADINAAVRSVGLPESFGADLIAKGTPIDAARTAILNEKVRVQAAEEPEAPARAVTFGEDARDKWVRGAVNWVLVRSGMAALVAKSEGIGVDKIDAGEFRGLSLLDMAKESLERSGVKTRGKDRMAIAGEAMAYRSNYQTTSDFATLLENAMHKVLRASYGITPDTWSRFCGIGNVSDFRTHNWYRTGALTVLDDLNEHGEFQTKNIPDAEKSTYSVATKGNVIGITREVIVNDDLGFVMRLIEMLGRAGKLTIEKAVYTQLTANAGLGPTQSNSQPLFHSSRSNVNTSASAITVIGIEADAAVMAAQLDPNGQDYLDLQPAVLLVPRAKRGDALTINDAQFDPADSKFQKPNTVRGLFSDVVATPRLSGTRRYLFANPSLAPVFMVSFLDGQREPVLETQDGWRFNGVEMKARLDFGVDVVDYRGAVTNAGA